MWILLINNRELFVVNKYVNNNGKVCELVLFFEQIFKDPFFPQSFTIFLRRFFCRFLHSFSTFLTINLLPN